MAATAEQQTAIDEILKDSCNLLKISACSGSGKTWTLVELTKNLKPKNGLYIAYNKAIATEASRKFPSQILCKTTHSLAYQSTVRPFNLRVGYFGYRDIKDKISYDDKLLLIKTLEAFCLSSYVQFTAYAAGTDLPKSLVPFGESILHQMATGLIVCTHYFYLKLYHIMLENGDLIPETLDVLLLDEAGDLNAVTLAIFLKYPAKKKVMVGDPNQNIYSFNHTINGFNELYNIGTYLSLSKSFRVSDCIAQQMERFAQYTFDPQMKFSGVEYPKDYITASTAYITRTNGYLITRMIDLNMRDIPYNLVRPAKTIFALPLTLMGLKEGAVIKNPSYKFLQGDLADYYGSRTLQKRYTNVLKYIGKVHAKDPGIAAALNVLYKHGAKTVYETKIKAEQHEGTKIPHSITLCTSHSSKG